MLQSYPVDYLFQGSRSKVFEQVGNSVPPLVAYRVGGDALGLPAVSDVRGAMALIACRPSAADVHARAMALPADVRALLMPWGPEAAVAGAAEGEGEGEGGVPAG